MVLITYDLNIILGLAEELEGYNKIFWSVWALNSSKFQFRKYAEMKLIKHWYSSLRVR